MSDTITIPSPAIIAERIRACRQEMLALKRLERMARLAQTAEQAREHRQDQPHSPNPAGASNQ